MQYFIFWSFTTFTAFLNLFELFWTCLRLFLPILACFQSTSWPLLACLLGSACLLPARLPACLLPFAFCLLPGASCLGRPVCQVCQVCQACVQYQITCSLRLALCLASCILHPASCVLCVLLCALSVCLILRSACCGESRVRAVWLHLPCQADWLADRLTGWLADWLTGFLAYWLTGWYQIVCSSCITGSISVSICILCIQIHCIV